MIPTTFEYARAASLDDALAKLKAANGGGKFIAGGHSLVPLMKLRLSEPQLLIDISRIPDLAGIRERDGKITIGAATVHHDVATSSLLQARCPVVSEAAATIGDPQVRNRGTIGGSLAHADPGADYPTVVTALGATIVAQGPNGERELAADDFFTGVFTTAGVAAIVPVSPAPLTPSGLTSVGVSVRSSSNGGKNSAFGTA